MLKHILSQPHPLDESDRRTFFVIILISLLMPLVMVIMRLVDAEQVPWQIHLGYAGITFLVLSIFLVFLPRVLSASINEEQWTVGKEIAWKSLTIFLVGFLNNLYFRTVMKQAWDLQEFFLFQLQLAAFVLIPTTAIILIKQNYLDRRNQIMAQTLNIQVQEASAPANPAEKAIVLHSENQNEDLHLKDYQIRVISSVQNYVEVNWLDQSKLQKTLLRNNLLNMEADLQAHPHFFRCHRSYIVNINSIEKITGNSKGYRLKISDLDEAIPVARNKSHELNERLASLRI